MNKMMHDQLPEMLTLIFIILKLCHTINWSWWFILMPFLLAVIIRFVMHIWHNVNDG